jgi:hypothetical protein
MIHRVLNHAEIGDSVAWNVGYSYYIGRVHDTHRSGLILKLRGKFLNFDWDFFDGKDAVVIPAEDVRRLGA